MTTRAIIVAAGRGRRLGPETDDIPKCMVTVAGQPILHWQLRALAGAGISDVVVVRGYLGDRIAAPGHALRFIENPEWPRNNIFASLLYAAAEMDGGFFFSYSDIVFAPAVAQALAAAAGAAPATLVVDRRWQDAYEGRTEHPLPEAELARVIASGEGPAVSRVGKQAVARDDAAGEFIGLAHFTAEGAAALRGVWKRRCARAAWTAPSGARPRCATPISATGSTPSPTRATGWRRSSSTARGARSTRARTWPAPSAPPPCGGDVLAGTDPGHWLHRLDPDEWLAAADNELALCGEALARRAFRPGVTHARRAAGMAVNAVLVLREEPRFGRSYMEHVVALAGDEAAAEPVRAAARLLRETPAAPPALVTLGKPDLRVLEAAVEIVRACRAQVEALRRA